jgi:hypothetical protein
MLLRRMPASAPKIARPFVIFMTAERSYGGTFVAAGRRKRRLRDLRTGAMKLNPALDRKTTSIQLDILNAAVK